MDTHLIINSDHPGFYYALFYFLAILCGFLLLVREGYKRGYDTIPWMVVIAAAFLFFIAGCRIVNFTGAEWHRILRFDSIPYGTTRSVLGGILFAIPGIWLAMKWLRFDHSMMDAFAFVLPVAIAIERFGCLLVGCCYGTPTELPWAIQYGSKFHAYMDQANAGLLPAGSTLSHPVHPVQLYEVAGTLLIILLLRNIGKYIQRGGNFLLSSVCLYGVLRFLLEFVRDHGEEARTMFWGLSLVQTALVVVVPLVMAVILFREIKVPARVVASSPTSPFRKITFLLFIGFLSLVVTRWFDALEIASLGIAWLPLLAMLAGYLFTRTTAPQFRLASIVLPAVCLFLMNQTIPERPTASARVSYNTISVGGMSGSSNFTDSQTATYSTGGGCDGSPYYSYTTSTSTKSDNQYSSAALGISRTVQVSDREFITFGVNGFSGSHHELFDQTFTTTQVGVPNQHINKNNEYSYSGIKPYFQYDNPNIGLGFGLMIGEMRRFDHQKYEGIWPTASSTVKMQPVVPSIYVRIGNLSKVFVDFGANSQFTPAYPVMTYQGAIGFGIGKGVLRLGTGSYSSFFIAPIIPVGKYFVIEPLLGFGGGGSHYKTADTTIGSMNIHYKIGRKERGMK